MTIKYWVFILLLLIISLLVMIQLRDNETALNQEINKEGVFLLNSLELETLELDLISGHNGVEFLGYTLDNILNKLDIVEDTVNTITFTSHDGRSIMVSHSEIIQHQVALIPNKGRKPVEYRLIFPNDNFRNRWIKNIYYFKID